MQWVEAYPRIEADWSQVEMVLRRQVPDQVPVVELFTDHDFIQAVLGYHWTAVAADKDYAEWQRYWLWRIEYQKLAGPAFLNAAIDGLLYPLRKVAWAANTADLALSDRRWVNETAGVVTTREEFEAYPWPTSPFNRQQIDYISRHDEQEVRPYVRRILEECTPGGGYALGTGNSVTNYIAMLQELAEFNREA